MTALARLLLAGLLAALGYASAQAEDVPTPLVSLKAPTQAELLATDPDTGVEQQLYSASYALLIGESVYPAYTNDDIPRIPDEFRELSKTLQDQNFNVTAYINLKGTEIRSVVSDFIRRYGYDRDARIVMLFAGHGQTRSDLMETDARSTEPLAPRTLGYLLPVDAPKLDDPEWPAKAVRFSEILEWADAIEAKHVLTLLDTCFSGAIFEGTRSLPKTKKKDPAWVVFRKPVQHRSRLFITAGTADQRVPKTSSIVQTFGRALRGEMKAELADYNEDGYLTGEEIFQVMYRDAVRETDTTPQRGWSRTPGMGRGDIVFKLPLLERPPLAARAVGLVAPPLNTLSKSIEGRCPEHCVEAEGVEERLELPVAPGVSVSSPSLACTSEDGGLAKWVQAPTWDKDGAKVSAVVRVWAGSALCSLTYRPDAIEAAIETEENSNLVETPEQFDSSHDAKMPDRLTSGYIRRHYRRKFYYGRRFYGPRRFYDFSEPRRPTLFIEAELKVGTTQIDLSNGKFFDYRKRLEVKSPAARRKARSELTTILTTMTVSDIDTIIRGLPNSSYRVGLGVSVALGDMKEKWTSVDPARSRKLLEQLPKLANNDATMTEAVKKALAKLESTTSTTE